jgi:hypothetical protein
MRESDLEVPPKAVAVANVAGAALPRTGSNRRRISLVLRIALWIVFASTIYWGPYRVQATVPYGVRTGAQAANAGYPFQLYFGPSTELRPPHIQPQELRKYSELYGDYGIHILTVLTSIAGRAVAGPQFMVDDLTAFRCVLALFLCVALVFVLPPVPFVVSAASVAALWIAIRIALITFGPSQLWGIVFGVVLCGAFIAIATGSERRRGRFAVLAVLALFIGFAQLLRQEAAAVAYVVGATLIASAAGISLRRGYRGPGIDAAVRAGVRTAGIAGVLLVLATLLVPEAVRVVYAIAWNTSLRDTRTAEHGSGWPLYLSLGYVSNPYNIGWRDPIGQLHVTLIDRTVVYGHPAFQSMLRREWFRLVAEHPAVLARNIVAKAKTANENLTETRPLDSIERVATQSLWGARLYELMPVAMLVSMVLAFYGGYPTALIAVTSFAALVVGASVGPILIHPGYFSGLQGASLACVLILPAAVIGQWRRRGASCPPPVRSFTRQTTKALLVAAVAGAALVAVAALIAEQRLAWRRTSVLADDPMSAISRLDFRYGHLFNDAPVVEQERVIARLRGMSDPRVASVVVDTTGSTDQFEPMVVVRTARQVHLIARLGAGFPQPDAQHLVFQGRTHSLVFLCGDCAAGATMNGNGNRAIYTMINDHEWRDRYRFLSWPSGSVVDTAGIVLAGAERVTGSDAHAVTWMATVPMATARLRPAVAGTTRSDASTAGLNGQARVGQ